MILYALLPMEIRADISASLAANLAGEQRLYVEQPNAIRPSVAADRCRMAALVIRAIDQETANASGPHFSEGDLSGWGGHAPLKRGLDKQAIPRGTPGSDRALLDCPFFCTPPQIAQRNPLIFNSLLV
jgi:hypothetical protein